MASSYCGYMGRVIEIDLGSRSIKDYPWTDKEREKFIGGKIMAAKILSDNFKGTEEPFSEENLLVISTGPLTGTGAPSSGRFNISTLSPQTGLMTSSNCGGTFGLYLKKAGYDALVIRGKCQRPTWLEIHNSRFIFRDASDMWGMLVGETQEALEEKLEKKHFGRLVIGPAGENLVKYSAVVSEERAAGRTGVGAVFGWKNLKAITVTGTHDIPIYDKEKANAHCRKWFRYLHNHPLTGNQLPRMGTAGLVSSMQMRGLLSTKNYNAGRYEHFDKVNGETLAEEHNVVNKGCVSCPIKCARTVCVDGKDVKGPELETLGLLGGGILNSNMELILRWNNELDELGMDTISAASTLAYAMEANEKGLWDNGLEFGKTEDISRIWEDIAFRRGVGDELAEGSKRLSEKYGGKDFAIQSKGMELAAYQPRRAVGQGLGYAVSNRGGCHINGGYAIIVEGLGLKADSQTPKGKADLCMVMQDLLEGISMGGQCIFTSYALFPEFLLKNPNGIISKAVNALVPHIGWAERILNRFPELIFFKLPMIAYPYEMEYAVGMKMSLGKFLRNGERSYNIERAVNARFGVSAEKDKLPKRLTHVPMDPNDPSTVVPLEEMKKVYYRARGWEKNGLPSPQKLKSLGIE